MTNAFQKLLIREFGKQDYRRMATRILLDEEEKLINLDVTCLICERLHQRKQNELIAMSGRLEDALLESYRISRGYLPYAICCLAGLVLLCLFVSQVFIKIPALVAVASCLIIKTKEYLLNRYCYVDARIILCYRVALSEMCAEIRQL